MACFNCCPFGAIEKARDKRGFFYPFINPSKCTECGKCSRICPVNSNVSEVSDFNQKVYACHIKDKNSRLSCTSGGAATAISEKLIEMSGKVYGAAFDENLTVCHSEAKKVKDLEKLKGSKYVQSDLGNVFKKIADDLAEDIHVLFIGTPCQVAGLQAFLGAENPLLITCDLVCHGVPSPLAFSKYIEHMESEHDSKVRSVNFRHKEPGWKLFSMKLDFENGGSYIGNAYEDCFHRAFLLDYICRDCCAKCKYANTHRVSDITLADFWGYKHTTQIPDDDKGISLVIVNTQKGCELFDSIKSSLYWIDKPLAEAVDGNPCLSHPFKPNKDKEKFWKLFLKQGFSKKIIKKYLYNYDEELRRKAIERKKKLRRDTFLGYIHAIKKNGPFGIIKKILHQ